MSDHRTYISVMTPAASSGQLDIGLVTYDADTNVSLVASITGITSGASEISIATSIETQLTVLLTASGAIYDGVPRFSAEPFAANWRVTRTDHIICLWSQADFTASQELDTTGAIYRFSTSPCLLTVAQAKNQAVINSISLVNKLNGTAMTDSQITDYLEAASADVTATMKNNIVLSGYLNEFRTNETKSVFIRPLPLTYVDSLRIRRKNLYEMYSIPQYSSLAYNKLFSKGEIEFRFNQTFVNAGEPFAEDNELRVTFIAGYKHIPIEIFRCVMFVGERNNNEHRGVESLGGGSLRVKWRDTKSELYRIYQPVKKYFMTKPRA